MFLGAVHHILWSWFGAEKAAEREWVAKFDHLPIAPILQYSVGGFQLRIADCGLRIGRHKRRIKKNLD